jgi:hypothetical protein
VDRRAARTGGAWPRCIGPLALSVLLFSPSLGLAGPIRHFVYGLDPRYRYDVAVGRAPIAGDMAPGAAGAISFESDLPSAVHIGVRTMWPNMLDSLSTGTSLRILGPFPNPVHDRAELVITSDGRGLVRVRIYDAAAGRIRVDSVTQIEMGVQSVWIEFPPRTNSGFYILRVDLPWGTVTRKIVFIRH